MVIFESCRVPVENRIGAEGDGFKIAMSGLDGGRLNIAACSLGGAQFCLERTIVHMKERKQFGTQLADFQALGFRVADYATELEASRLMLYRAADALDRARERRHAPCCHGQAACDRYPRRLRLLARSPHRTRLARPTRAPNPRRYKRGDAADRQQGPVGELRSPIYETNHATARNVSWKSCRALRGHGST